MDAKRCFVISPIGQEGSAIRAHADDVYRFVIEPAMAELGVEVVRSDRMAETGTITEQMFREIFNADVCIAVLTGMNPNVFYELAVAQSAARPLITLIEKGQPLPFDVKDLRTVQYEMQPISRLVDGTYAKQVAEQLRGIANRGWVAPSLLDEHGYVRTFQNEQELRRLLQEGSPRPLSSGTDRRYRLPQGPETEIVVVTGDVGILAELDVDVVVSLEDTHFQLARYFDASISGTLRYLDAEKTAGGSIRRDALAESLQQQIRALELSLPVTLGTVVATPTCELTRHGTRFVFHVAAMQGAVSNGYATYAEIVDDCVGNALDRFARLAPEHQLDSILFPMLGAASSGLDPVEVAHQILTPIVQKVRRIPECRRVYLLAWLAAHRDALREVAAELGLETVAAAPAPGAPVVVPNRPAENGENGGAGSTVH